MLFRSAAVDDELKTVKANIIELEATAEEIGNRLGLRQITLARHDAIVTPLDEQLVKLYARAAQLEASAPARRETAKLESRAVWEQRWAAADITRQREYLKGAFGGRRLLVSAGPRLQPARERCSFGVSASDDGGDLSDL